MSLPIHQEYVIETKDGDFYEEEVQLYADNKPVITTLKVTRYIKDAERFSSLDLANDIAYAYDFKVLALNTYLEEIN
ncbi:hypothetical protein [Staphylococcus haemolyticus]|uniref:hypothetical protein n=1 Tax=Staphylococcus haemolyticus TaxID=1283 RepID=UPI00119E745D|nr:hypothetical protein [Staphylococcus haemolyticus]